jgi:hypothetical protein
MRRLSQTERVAKDGNTAFFKYMGVDISLFNILGKEFATAVLTKEFTFTIPHLTGQKRKDFEQYLNDQANQVLPDCGPLPIKYGAFWSFMGPHINRLLGAYKNTKRATEFSSKFNALKIEESSAENPYQSALLGNITLCLSILYLDLKARIPHINKIQNGQVSVKFDEVIPLDSREIGFDRSNGYLIPDAIIDKRKVVLGTHCIKRMRERIGFSNPQCDYVVYYALKDAKVINYRGTKLVSIGYDDKLVGYMVVDTNREYIYAKTFLLATMEGTPEGDAFRKAYKTDRQLLKYVGLDSLAKIAHGKLADDDNICLKFKAVGLQSFIEFAQIIETSDHDKGMKLEAYRLFRLH